MRPSATALFFYVLLIGSFGACGQGGSNGATLGGTLPDSEGAAETNSSKQTPQTTVSKPTRPTWPHPSHSPYLADETGEILAAARKVSLGEKLPPPVKELTSDEGWKNLGFLGTGDGELRRQARLDRNDEALVLTRSEQIPAVDLFAMISIDRHGSEEPYVYGSINSFFEAFPDDVHLNILVGNDDDSYLSSTVLNQKVGPSRAARVHVYPLDSLSSRYLSSHFASQRKGGWNYSRALRNYRGSNAMILMEDDVLWARDSGRFIQDNMPHFSDAVSFYNFDCYAPKHAEFSVGMARSLVPTRIQEKKFVCTQGMLYRASLANALGDYLQTRIHERVWDWLMEIYFEKTDSTVDFIFPGVVQHVGFHSAGVTPYFHQSSCFDPGEVGAR